MVAIRSSSETGGAPRVGGPVSWACILNVIVEVARAVRSGFRPWGRIPILPAPGRIGILPHRLAAFALGTILGAGLLAVRDALGVEHAADDVIAHTGQVADTAAADQHD